MVRVKRLTFVPDSICFASLVLDNSWFDTSTCLNQTYMQPLMAAHLPAIQEICKSRHVRNLYLFGSVLTNQFTDKSDIDFLVEFGPISLEDYADNYFDLCADLELILGRQVEVVTMRSVKNPYFENELLKTRQLVFEA